MEEKKWIKKMIFICAAFLYVFVFPQNASAAQVNLSVGDTTTVSLLESASLKLKRGG